MRRRRAARPALVFLAAALAGCGGGGATGPTAAYISQAVTPDPVVATPATEGAQQYAAAFTLTLTEGAGVGVTVRDVSVAVYEVVGGTSTALDSTQAAVAISMPTPRIEANKTLALGYDVRYTLPSGGRAAQVKSTLAFVDDKGNSYTGTVTVNIT